MIYTHTITLYEGIGVSDLTQHETIDAIEKAIAAHKNDKPADSASSVLVKLALALATAGIGWIAVGVSDIKGDIKADIQWKQSATIRMNDFSLFMKEPRFTLEDYTARDKTTRLEIQINRNATIENKRVLLRLENKIDHMDKKVY